MSWSAAVACGVPRYTVRTARPRLLRVRRTYSAWRLGASCPVRLVRTVRRPRGARVSTGGHEGDEVETWREEAKRRRAGRGARELAEDGAVGRWRRALAEERHPAQQRCCGQEHACPSPVTNVYRSLEEGVNPGTVAQFTGLHLHPLQVFDPDRHRVPSRRVPCHTAMKGALLQMTVLLHAACASSLHVPSRWSDAHCAAGSRRWIEMIRSKTICPLAKPDDTKVRLSRNAAPHLSASPQRLSASAPQRLRASGRWSSPPPVY